MKVVHSQEEAWLYPGWIYSATQTDGSIILYYPGDEHLIPPGPLSEPEQPQT